MSSPRAIVPAGGYRDYAGVERHLKRGEKYTSFTAQKPGQGDAAFGCVRDEHGFIKWWFDREAAVSAAPPGSVIHEEQRTANY